MTIKKFGFVEYGLEGNVAVIRMNNPARRNSMSFAMQRDLNDAFGEFEDDDNARVEILTGVGNSFSSGWDTKDQNSMTNEQR